MQELIKFSYYIAMFIMAVSYFPQIYTLLKDQTGAKAINLFTAFLWSVATIIFLLYAVVINEDTYIIAYGVINTTGCAGIFGISLYNRFIKVKKVVKENG